VQDYREVDERFDHIISLGMFEHVGVKNYAAYFDVVRRCLKDNGLFLLHTIGDTVSRRTGDPWLLKYIFPGGMLPSIAQIGKAAEKRLVMEDWHNFGADYDKTLLAWFANFEQAWPTLRAKYGDRFYRMWKYYLLSCAGVSRVRKMHLWQIVFSKHGVPGGYVSVR
jgi:cyclopropane-fatty-acyl-phospholipid synthase